MSSDEREVVPGVLRGYRAWLLTGDGVLTALHGYLPWRPGKNTAICANGHFVVPPTTGYQNRLLHEEESPAAECTCGIYAMHTPEEINAACAYVTGSIKAYGKVILHTDGFRAQYAEIEGFMLNPLIDKVSLIQSIRNRYQVPIYSSGAELLYHHPPIPVTHLMPEPELPDHLKSWPEHWRRVLES